MIKDIHFYKEKHIQAAMQNTLSLSIVIPCYNEEKSIPFLVTKFIQSCPKNLSSELILVNNGSEDASAALLRKLAKKHHFLKVVTIKQNSGYGDGIYKGLQSAKGEFLCWTHADLQTDLKDTFCAYELMRQQQKPEQSFVKGSRKNRPFVDRFFTFCMSVFETFILKTFLDDINAQPTLFHKSFLKDMGHPPSDFSFDLYAYYLAKKKGFTIARFPVFFKPRTYGASHWNTSIRAKGRFIKRTVLFTVKLKKQLKGA